MKIFDIIYFTCDWVTYIAILIGSILCKYTVNDFIIDIHKINKDLRSSRFYKLYDEAERQILRFLRYVDARPLKQRVLGLLPVDLTLPVSVLSFCVTYLIMVIQLTHLD
ncbi:uncharacterized protein LOC135309917 [Plodia interpunctella]|uniref:uncharacterized protein LOC135309917 n=1 Tax=Plodia interpunctella TaxID=58824 RepID=UPI003100F108